MTNVVPFPLVRRVGYVDRQARSMALMNSHAAEEYLSQQLKRHEDIFRRKGIDQARVDRELASLTNAIRARLFQEVLSSPGDA